MGDRRSYYRRRYKIRRAELIASVGGVCVICGTDKNLQLDHIDRTTKTLDISKHMCDNRAKVVKEAALCQLLCVKCHCIKSIEEAGNTVTHLGGVHGTLTSYRYCSCDICKLAKSIYNKYKKRISQSLLKDLFLYV